MALQVSNIWGKPLYEPYYKKLNYASFAEEETTPDDPRAEIQAMMEKLNPEDKIDAMILKLQAVIHDTILQEELGPEGFIEYMTLLADVAAYATENLGPSRKIPPAVEEEWDNRLEAIKRKWVR
ncbi:hypothetical protein OESDEN_21054 [Oesophagostomum dentatum]|uniref:Uncharacterized protein n=1 Tax=Oesophagostomum dentatum TaxID=61180 RepID=A0A0B1S1S2_OESDE|nr:hypothetical protein OESDEN_21054 [Oesophagostomum dentatum]